MASGTPLPDVGVGHVNITPEFRAPNQFTPFSADMLKDVQANMTRSPEGRGEITSVAPKYQEPMTTSNDKQLTDQLMAEIMDQKKSKKSAEIISHIEKKIPEEKKSQGFMAQIIEWFRSIFR